MPSFIPILICVMYVCVIDMLLLFLHCLYVVCVRDVCAISGWVLDGLQKIRRLRTCRMGIRVLLCISIQYQKNRGEKKDKER